jgi:hypothetical protein
MKTATTEKFVVKVHTRLNRDLYFKNIKNGLVHYVKRETTAKTFSTKEDAQKFADILYRLTIVKYEVVQKGI